MQISDHDPEAPRFRLDCLRENNVRLREALERECARINSRSNVGYDHTARMNDSFDELTPREMEVLRLIAEGCSTREAARRLGIAFKTAACHRHRLMQKLDVHATGSLMRVAIAAGIVEV